MGCIRQFSPYASLLLVAFLPFSSQGQDTSAPPATAPAAVADPAATPAPAPAPATAPAGPLARFIPGDGLRALFEFEGFDAHGASWRGTATYRILNETTTGEMLDSLTAQMIDHVAVSNPKVPWNGADSVTLMKHVLQHGAVVSLHDPAAGSQDPGNLSIMVIRNAARKDFRPLFAKFVSYMMGPEAKASKNSKGNRQIIEVTGKESGRKWAWWTEKDDLVLVSSADAVDTLISTFEGTRPNAVDNAIRAELMREENGFQPVAWGFFDPKAKAALPANLQTLATAAGLDTAQRVDFRWGFEGSALMTVARVLSPAPRQGRLALMDQAAFSVNDLPPIPADARNFAALSLNFDVLFQQVLTEAQKSNPKLAQQMTDFEQTVSQRTRQRFREDILSQLGPKLAFIGLPPLATPGAGGAAGKAAQIAAALPQGFRAPRAAAVFEIKDSAKLGKILDELMILANKTLDEQFSSLGLTPPPSTQPGQPASPKPKAKADSRPKSPRFQRPSVSTPLFVLTLPTEYAAVTNLQLTVALGQKHLVIATSPNTAQKVLELEGKPQSKWAPQGALAQSAPKLPASLVYFQVTDRSASLPDTLANLPSKVEELLSQVDIATGVKAAPAFSLPGVGQPGAGSSSGLMVDSSSRDMDSSSYEGSSSDSSSSNESSSESSDETGSGSSSGYPSSTPATPAGPPGTVKLDPAKAPKAEAIRALLFPTSIAVSVNEQGLTLIGREAFPSINLNTDQTNGLLMQGILSRGGAGAASTAAPEGQPADAAAPAPASTPAPGSEAPQP